MPIYDVTVPLRNEMPTYPGDPGVKIADWSSLEKGDAANVSVLHFGAHTGTHLDAPAHFIAGAPKIESLSLDVLIGKASVIEVPSQLLSIDENFVGEHCPPGILRVLFKTRNSTFWNDSPEFRKDFTYLELKAAALLVKRGIRLVGIDYLSIEKFGQKEHEPHLDFLSHGVIIVEGLTLTSITPGPSELICLPLRIQSGQGDGAPARVVLKTLD